MKITELSIQEFLGIKAFKVSKAGKLNLITGENGAGKSSVLKAIQEAFKATGVNPNMIHANGDKAEILIRLDNGIAVERTITQGQNKVKVVDGDGTPITSPQAFLKGLLGDYTFSPIEFFRAKPAKRRQQLLSAIPITLTRDAVVEATGDNIDTLNGVNFDRHGLEVLADLQKTFYDARHEQGLHVTRLKKALEQDRRDIPETFKADRFKDFDFKAKMAALEQANQQMSAHNERSEKLDRLRKRSEQIADEIQALEEKIIALKIEREGIQAEGVQLREELDKYVEPPVDQLRAEIDAFQAAQKTLAKIEEIDNRQERLAGEEEKHAWFERMHGIVKNDLPQKLLAEASLPIDGIAFVGDKITWNGVPIEMLSDSEKMRFSVSIARALAKELQIICVDGYEALDSKTRTLFETQAAGDDFEYFIARVGDGPLQMEAVA